MRALYRLLRRQLFCQLEWASIGNFEKTAQIASAMEKTFGSIKSLESKGDYVHAGSKCDALRKECIALNERVCQFYNDEKRMLGLEITQIQLDRELKRPGFR